MNNDKYLIYGAMGIGGEWSDAPLTQGDITKGIEVIETALDCGIDFFDFADIYRMGKSEQVMGEFLKKNPTKRSEIIIQSKVGIRLNHIPSGSAFDFTYDHILKAVDGILERLGTDYLDILLLHRPDPLMEKEEISEAINKLFADGKIQALGVSNMDHHQIDLLEDYTERKVVVNQLEMSLEHSDFVYSHIGFNNDSAKGSTYPLGTTEYCMTNGVSLQSWSPLARGIYSGRSLEGATEHVVNTANLVEKLAAEYGVSREGIVLGWLMRHPAKIRPVIGSANPARIRACMDALKVDMSREHWYRLLVAARGVAMP